MRIIGLLLGASAAACAKDAAPTAPASTTSTPPPICRNYATDYSSVLTTSGPIRYETRTACMFDLTANTLTCTTSPLFANSQPAVRRTYYQSTAAFIGEARVVPPLIAATRVTDNSAAAAGAPASDLTVDYAYDAVGRLSSQTSSTGLTPVTYMFRGWDSSGRPLAATYVASGLQTMTFEYDGSTGTRTTRDSLPPSPCTTTFDSNANEIGSTCGSSTTVRTVNAVERLCQ